MYDPTLRTAAIPTTPRLQWLFIGVSWIASLFVAYVFLWSEQYKLTAHPGAVMLFTILTDWMGAHGHEAAFRLFTAAMEMLASLFILIPRTRFIGALLAVAVMSGAIFFHLVSPLGIDPYHDGGTLFRTACQTWLCAAIVLLIHRRQGLALWNRIRHG